MHKKEYRAPQTDWTLISINCQILQGSPGDGGMDEGGELTPPLFPNDLLDGFSGLL